MGDGTGIVWTDATWNPVTGCEWASAGCDNCYAARDAAGRLSGRPQYQGLAVKAPGQPARFTGELRLLPERLDQPLRWTGSRLIFVNSMSDLYHPGVPTSYIAQVYAVMALAHWHTFQVLTKRPRRMAQLSASTDFQQAVSDAMHDLWRAAGRAQRARWQAPDCDAVGARPWPLPNVWLGTSIEDDHSLYRLGPLADTDAAVRWVSAEPLIGWGHTGPLMMADALTDAGVGWVVVGGESGPGARPMHLAWARTWRDATRLAGARFLFKQLGHRLAADLGVPGKGDDHTASGFPADLAISEYPTTTRRSTP